MTSVIEIMRKSNSQILKQEAEDLAKWSKLKHTKQDLELFLQFNIAEIQFKTKTETKIMICTSNMTLVKIMNQTKKEDKLKLVDITSSGITTKDPKSVLTYDLTDKKHKSINLANWQIINFVSIFPSNILLIDELLNKLM